MGILEEKVVYFNTHIIGLLQKKPGTLFHFVFIFSNTMGSGCPLKITMELSHTTRYTVENRLLLFLASKLLVTELP